MKLKIVTPLGTAVDTEVDIVTLVSSEGLIEIFPGHASYTGLLKTGLISYSSNGEAAFVVSESGFVQINDDDVTILTSDIKTKDNIDIKGYAKNREDLGKQLASSDITERQLAERELAKINAIDQLLSIN